MLLFYILYSIEMEDPSLCSVNLLKQLHIATKSLLLLLLLWKQLPPTCSLTSPLTYYNYTDFPNETCGQIISRNSAMSGCQWIVHPPPWLDNPILKLKYNSRISGHVEKYIGDGKGWKTLIVSYRESLQLFRLFITYMFVKKNVLRQAALRG